MTTETSRPDGRRRLRHTPLSSWGVLPPDPPSAAEIRAFLARYSMTQAELGRAWGATVRAVEGWVAPPGTSRHRPAPRALWHLFDNTAQHERHPPRPRPAEWSPVQYAPEEPLEKERLRRFIAGHDLSQAAFAAAADVRLNALKEWLAGRRPVPRWVWHVVQAVDIARWHEAEMKESEESSPPAPEPAA